MKKMSSAAGARRTARTAEAFFMSLKTNPSKERSPPYPETKRLKIDDPHNQKSVGVFQNF